MDNVVKIVLLAVAVLFAVLIIVYASTIANTGKDIFTDANASLSATTSGIASSEFDIYDGTAQTGESVLRLITTTYNDVNVEVLVCTKDGANYIYNTDKAEYLYGVSSNTNNTTNVTAVTTAETCSSAGKVSAKDALPATKYYLVMEEGHDMYLSNIAPMDATGKAFSGGAAPVYSAHKGWNLCTSNGYNATTGKDTKGYISTSSYFDCTVQKDKNNEVRRVTFVQR